MSKRGVEIFKYAGGNAVIDQFAEPTEELWIVNAKAGRKVVILPLGSTSEDAWNRYEERFC